MHRRIFLREVEHFFGMYKELEGHETELLGWDGRTRAAGIIRECEARYAEWSRGR